MKLLVLDAYAPAGREALIGAGATLAGELYGALLRRLVESATGNTAEIEIAYPADSNPNHPRGSELSGFDGAVWTGSSLTILEAEQPAVRQQIDLARELIAEGVPCFGSCWAAQLAVVAAGGKCTANPRGREFGIARKIALDTVGRSHAMFAGKPDVFDAFTSHADHIGTLPDGGTLLASNAFSRVQAVVVERGSAPFWAVQYHPEYDPHEVAALCRLRAAELIAQGTFADRSSADRFAEGMDALFAEPDRQDLATEFDVGPELLDERVRTREVANWLAFIDPAREPNEAGA